MILNIRQVLKNLKGKTFLDVSLKLLREFFIIKTKFSLRGTSGIKFAKNLVVLDEKRIPSFIKLDSSSFFGSCDQSKIIDWANGIRSHVFNLLGSGSVKVSYNKDSFRFQETSYNKQPNNPVIFFKRNVYEPIDWHCDFKSGYRWNKNIAYNKIGNISNGLKGVDIKIPWELSRFQHLSVLVKAHRLTNDKSYLEEVIHQITDWILNNEAYKGVNWACTMDVSIRLANWSVALDYVESQYDLSKSFKSSLCKSIQQHIKYIIYNLEWTHRLTSNHYLSNISGLYISCSYHRKYKFLRKWSKYQLEKEIFKQTYSDGMNSESSTSYHRLVLELFAFPVYFSRNEFSVEYKERLEKMFDFIFWIRKDDGSIPLFGDNDSGLFFYYSSKQKINLKYFNYLFQDIFERKVRVEKYNGIKLFEESGVFIYKLEKIYLGIANMPNGQKTNGGHCHNDKLSFELTINDKNIIVDPGCYVYTPFPDLRNRYRSTLCHNTVSVENAEQNRFIDDNLFSVAHDANFVTSKVYYDPSNFCNFTGTHNGYQRAGRDYTHRRSFKITKSAIYIDDGVISETKTVNCSAKFLIPEKHFKGVVDNVVICELLTIEFSSYDLDFNEKLDFAPEYGLLTERLVIISVNFVNELKTKISMLCFKD